jgi:TolA-binding protein
MAFLRLSLLVWLALVLSGGPLLADSGSREQRAYTAAVNAFQDEMWGRAETQFARFTRNFPDSTNVPQARLLQAQAAFKQRAFAHVVKLLTTNLAAAGNLADQYVYWIGEAQFQSGDFSKAAASFDLLAGNYPESPLRLRAVVEAASAFAQLAAWQQLVALLENNDGVFQRAVPAASTNELVSRGQLLLAQAKFALKDFGGASAVLDAINPQTLSPALDWQRIYLLCQVELAAGETNAALAASTNLLQAVRLDRDAGSTMNLSVSVALRADVLEKLGRTREALTAYQENLTNGAPVAIQQQAILKIAALASALDQFSEATNALANFLGQFPGSPAADMALLALGELQLKAHVTDPADTNLLALAQAGFDQFLNTFTNSPLVGKAHLDRGWCLWLAGQTSDSLNDFKMAVKNLPFSEDLAVAKFKLGDALFAQKDFSGALENYLAVWEDFTDFPAVIRMMGDRALYQSLRADLELGDLESASNVLAQIQKNYAGGPAQNSALLFGESWAELRSPPGARAQFAKIEEQYPDSPLRPQVALAVAHTYELEKNWPAVVTNYAAWLGDFPTNPLSPQVIYALAWANFQAGDETNAFVQFTNFVQQFPTNDLAPQAQWWVADHFFRAGDWADAERNYKSIFQNTNWQGSPLADQTNLFYPAQMMAGRSALARLGYSDAVGYFTSMAGDTNCPLELAVPARFAYGCTLMLMPPTDTNNPLANFQLATNVFSPIAQAYPTNQWGAQALIESGNCDLQMANFDAATNAYAQVFNSPFADVSARSQAQIGFGIVLEKLAALASGASQDALLEMAWDNYYDVFKGNNLRNGPGEESDPFWQKKAGLEAERLAEYFQAWPTALKYYQHMTNSWPSLQPVLENKIERLIRDHPEAVQN